jgi:DNA adenine methylase
MPITYTPLRYPGGKNALAGYLRAVLIANRIRNAAYVEPYCGGAGAALNLLFSEVVSEVYLNDLDPAIYAFWRYCLDEPDALCERLSRVPLTVAQWKKQRRALDDTPVSLELAFAVLYLNRVNRSGILRGGLIGGNDQSGQWKMDARFNRKGLIEKVRQVARYRSRIHVSNMDALQFLKRVVNPLPGPVFTYIDPPYVQQGRFLYENHYTQDDHKRIAEVLLTEMVHPWIASYDKCRLIQDLYAGCHQLTYSLSYSAQLHQAGREIIVFGPGVQPPKGTPKTIARSIVVDIVGRATA